MERVGLMTRSVKGAFARLIAIAASQRALDCMPWRPLARESMLSRWQVRVARLTIIGPPLPEGEGTAKEDIVISGHIVLDNQTQ